MDLVGVAIVAVALVALYLFMLLSLGEIQRWRMRGRVPAGLPVPTRKDNSMTPPIISELQRMATNELGNRSTRVNEILCAAEPNATGIEQALEQISALKIRFVADDRMIDLVRKMRERVRGRTGA